LQGHFTKLEEKEKKNVCEAQIVQLVTVSGNMQQLPVSNVSNKQTDRWTDRVNDKK